MASIAKLELRSLTDFQKELHETHILTDGDGNPLLDSDGMHQYEEIGALHHHEFQKCTWTTKYEKKLDCKSSEGMLQFVNDKKLHFLESTKLIQFLPGMRIKAEYRERYRICWPHNPALSTIKQCILERDDDDLQTLDKVWLDTYFEWCIKGGFREQTNIDLGNLPMLEEWNVELKPYKTKVVIPWFFSEDIKLGLPIFLSPKNVDIINKFEMKTKIKDILRMRYLTKDKYGQEIWVDLQEIDMSVLEGIKEDATFKTPELWAEYSYVTKNEENFEKTCNNKKQFVRYFNDVVVCDDVNAQTFNKNVEVDLDCENPCNAIFWCAENLNASEFHNFSNYTTHTKDIHKGWNPIEHVSLKYGEKDRFKNKDTIHFSQPDSKYVRSPPSVAGHNVHPIADRFFSIDAESGLSLSKLKAKMVFKLKNNDPFAKDYNEFPKDPNEEGREDLSETESIRSHQSVTSYLDRGDQLVTDKPQFQMHVRLLIVRKLVIDIIDAENEKYEWSIV